MVARNYAEALFELAERHQAHEAFAAAAATVAGLLADDPRIGAFLAVPKIEPRAKKQVLRAALAGRVPPLFLNFVLVVVDKRRQALLGEIARSYRALLDEKLGRLHVDVTLAHEPDAATEQRIAGELGRILRRTVVPHVRIDESILGGIVVRYGDQVLDGSLLRRLASLRSRMLEAALPPGGARGRDARAYVNH